MLPKLINALSILCLISGCQLTSDQQSLVYGNNKLKHQPLDLTHSETLAIIDEDPWDLFTDHLDPYGCSLTGDPEQSTDPQWAEPDTIWQRIRLGYELRDHWGAEHKTLNAEFNWYARHPEYMARVSQRAGRYIFHVVEQLEAHKLPLELALLPIVESAYDPFAYSHGRASGLWQFIPSTGRMYRLRQDWWYDGRRDVIASTNAAIRYLKTLNDYYKGDWLLALAAYNSGQGNVNRAIRRNKRAGKPTNFWALQLPRETRSYVPKLLALSKLLDTPRRYGIEPYPVPNHPYFATVNTGSQIDLAQAADMAGIDINELYLLNPGYNRWATSPKGPHRLLVPVSQQQEFQQALQELPPKQRLHWQRYTIKSGDSLLLLAKRFNTQVDTIRQVNNIKGNMIRAGQSLMIPTASQRGSHYALSAEQRLDAIQNKRRGSKGSQQLFHAVLSGDSLWTISRRYGITVPQLASWNGMAPKDILKPGQKLSIWLPAKQGASTARAGQRENIVRKVGYKVRSGDSLARIAGKFNVSVNDIVRWNAVNPKKYLQPGQRLTLFVDVMNTHN